VQSLTFTCCQLMYWCLRPALCCRVWRTLTRSGLSSTQSTAPAAHPQTQQQQTHLQASHTSHPALSPAAWQTWPCGSSRARQQQQHHERAVFTAAAAAAAAAAGRGSSSRGSDVVAWLEVQRWCHQGSDICSPPYSFALGARQNVSGVLLSLRVERGGWGCTNRV
jgi:hypothetical protein